MNINNRIKELVNTVSNGNISEFSTMIGLKNNVTLNRIVNSKNNPGYKIFVSILHNVRNVNPYWLLLGEGEMLIDDFKNEVDYDKMKSAFNLQLAAPSESVKAEIPMKFYDDLRSDYVDERARVNQLIKALTGDVSKSEVLGKVIECPDPSKKKLGNG